jgi:hypothetical protein
MPTPASAEQGATATAINATACSKVRLARIAIPPGQQSHPVGMVRLPCFRAHIV